MVGVDQILGIRSGLLGELCMIGLASTRRTALWLALCLLLAPAFAYGVINRPTAVLLLVVVTAVAATMFWRPVWIVGATLLAGLLPLPQGMSRSLNVAGSTIYAFEPLLYVAVVWALLKLPRRSPADLLSLVWFVFVGIWVVAGALGGVERSQLLTDARGLADMGAAFFLAARVIKTVHAPGLITLLKVILWASAGAAVLTSVGLLAFGSTEAATLVLDSGGTVGTDAVRVRLPAASLAIAALSASAALALTGRVGLRACLPWLVPSLIVVFLSFSRNNLLGIAAALVFAFVVTLSVRTVWKFAIGLVSVGIVGTLFALVAPVVAGVPGISWLTEQVNAFSGRVLDGLSSTTLQTDTSVLYRDTEYVYGWTAIGHHPLIGNGLGFAYKPAYGAVSGFAAQQGQYYSHNFYLWLLIKAGVVGVLVFALLCLPGLLLRIRTAGTARLAAAIGGVSLLAVSVVSPQPLGSSSSLVLGLMLGAAAGLVVAPSRRGSEERNAHLVTQRDEILL